MPLVKIEEGTSTVQVWVSNGNKIGRLYSKKIIILYKKQPRLVDCTFLD